MFFLFIMSKFYPIKQILKNIEIISEEETHEYSDKTIRSILYSADYVKTRFNMYMNLIDFKNDDRLVWVLIIAPVSYAEKHFDEWDMIIRSAKIHE